MSEWKSFEDELLIDFVKNHELLYNVKSQNYRKSQLKLTYWKEIAHVLLNKTDAECMKRWNYIRDYYIRRRGKPGTGSGGEAAKRRSEQLAFLDSHSSVKRSTISNVRNSTSEISSQAEPEPQNFSIESEENYSQDRNFQVPITQVANSLIIPSEQTSRESAVRKNKRSSNSQERLKLLKQIAEKRPLSDDQDETDLFFLSMAKITKKLPHIERARLRLQIGNLVSRAEIKQLADSADTEENINHRSNNHPVSVAETSTFTHSSDESDDYLLPSLSP